MSDMNNLRKEAESIAKNIVEDLREEMNIRTEKDNEGFWHFYLVNNSQRELLISLGLGKEYKKEYHFDILNNKKALIKKLAYEKYMANKLIAAFGNKQNLLNNTYYGTIIEKEENYFSEDCYSAFGSHFIRFGNEFIKPDDTLISNLKDKGFHIGLGDFCRLEDNSTLRNEYYFIDNFDGTMTVRDKFGISSSLIPCILGGWKDTLKQFKRDFYIVFSGLDSVSIVRKNCLKKLMFRDNNTFVLNYSHKKEEIEMRLNNQAEPVKTFK